RAEITQEGRGIRVEGCGATMMATGRRPAWEQLSREYEQDRPCEPLCNSTSLDRQERLQAREGRGLI
ncbi:unnamed protein product, partial [Closterium sp. Naga37s-1]